MACERVGVDLLAVNPRWPELTRQPPCMASIERFMGIRLEHRNINQSTFFVSLIFHHLCLPEESGVAG